MYSMQNMLAMFLLTKCMNNVPWKDQQEAYIYKLPPIVIKLLDNKMRKIDIA